MEARIGPWSNDRKRVMACKCKYELKYSFSQLGVIKDNELSLCHETFDFYPHYYQPSAFVTLLFFTPNRLKVF